MNVKNKIHTARFKDLDKEQEQFINARVTTPQTYDEIKNKGTATILKIASKGIVEKLLKRCEYYKQIINKKTETIKSKNELIGLLAGRLQNHEPELFNTDFKDKAEEVEKAKNEEVKTDLDEQGLPELTAKEKEQVETDNKKLDEDIEEGEREIDPEPDKEPAIEKCEKCGKEYEDTDGHDCDNDDIDDGGDECGEGGDGPDIDDIDETEEKEDQDDEIEEDKEKE